MTLEAKVITVSDSAADGSRVDASGPLAARCLESLGFVVIDRSVVPDGTEPVTTRLRELTDGFAGLVVTTGGTGFGPRDLTPEATEAVIERRAPGLAEGVRASGPLGALSRGVAGTVGRCLILNLPGSPNAVSEGLDAVGHLLEHAVALLRGDQDHHAHRLSGTNPEVDPATPTTTRRGSELTHIDPRGQARMVDVSTKPPTRRRAGAACRVQLTTGLDRALADAVDPAAVLGEARIAGIQAAKLTSSLIPLCHPIALSSVTVDLTVDDRSVVVSATVETVERTGVEMEALTACCVAALTVVGACRTADPPPSIEDLTVWEKSGGRSGDWRRTVGPRR